MIDVLIFDDDPYVSDLMSEMLGAMGLSVKCFEDGKHALPVIREEKPRLVIADLMMPGLDGISICLMVKNDPELSKTKVAIVSGKGFQEDKDKALKVAAADLYLQKPFGMATFQKSIGRLINYPPAAEKAESWPVKVWGGSGSGCLSLRIKEDLYIFDAGSSLEALIKDRLYWNGVWRVWLLLSHYHKDHIAGLAHAAAWANGGIALNIAGPRDSVTTLSGTVTEAFKGLPVETLQQQVKMTEMSEGETLEGSPLEVTTISTMHPGTCLGYRLDGDGRRLVFIPDNEIKDGWEDSMTGSVQKMAVFAQGADLLIHDSRYLKKDFPGPAQGHSTPQESLRLALRAGVKRLMLYHADPKYDAAARKGLLAEAEAAIGTKKTRPELLLADDGSVIAL